MSLDARRLDLNNLTVLISVTELTQTKTKSEWSNYNSVDLCFLKEENTSRSPAQKLEEVSIAIAIAIPAKKSNIFDILWEKKVDQ